MEKQYNTWLAGLQKNRMNDVQYVLILGNVACTGI